MNNSLHSFLSAIMICSSLLLASCGGSSSNNEGPPVPVKGIDINFPAGAEVPDNRYVDTYKILVFGNSHVHSHNLTGLLHDLIIAGRPEVKVQQTIANGSSYLDERLVKSTDLHLSAIRRLDSRDPAGPEVFDDWSLYLPDRCQYHLAQSSKGTQRNTHFIS